jgi:hypothetical protein
MAAPLDSQKFGRKASFQNMHRDSMAPIERIRTHSWEGTRASGFNELALPHFSARRCFPAAPLDASGW